jgi:hypothetical protein
MWRRHASTGGAYLQIVESRREDGMAARDASAAAACNAGGNLTGRTLGLQLHFRGRTANATAARHLVKRSIGQKGLDQEAEGGIDHPDAPVHDVAVLLQHDLKIGDRPFLYQVPRAFTQRLLSSAGTEQPDVKILRRRMPDGARNCDDVLGTYLASKVPQRRHCVLHILRPAWFALPIVDESRLRTR